MASALVVDKDLEKVKSFLLERDSVKQSAISSSLRINPGKVSEILTVLEDEGIVRKYKQVHNGHAVNTVAVIKPTSPLPAVVTRATTDNGPTGRVFFESPCFFCKQLDTCGNNTTLNFYNCPKLNAWIEKDLN